VERDRAELAKQKEEFDKLQKQTARKINPKPETTLDLNSKGLSTVDLYDYVNLTTLNLGYNKLR